MLFHIAYTPEVYFYDFKPDGFFFNLGKELKVVGAHFN